MSLSGVRDASGVALRSGLSLSMPGDRVSRSWCARPRRARWRTAGCSTWRGFDAVPIEAPRFVPAAKSLAPPLRHLRYGYGELTCARSWLIWSI